MSQPPLLRFVRPALIALSVTLSACSVHPVKDAKSFRRAEPPNGNEMSSAVEAPDPHVVAIPDEPDEPLPVVLLESDPTNEGEGQIEQDHDIWQRVRDGFALGDSADDDPRVRKYLAWHQANPDYLHRVTGRAEPYLYFILEEIERRQMPTELLLLPVIESAYIPNAYSRSHAAGIWQFIPSTGSLYGLKQNWWYDGRRDIYASTLAALDYLESLNELFEGDWFHSLAAYNCGPNRVFREIAINSRQGKPTDYWHLKLPSETRSYIPKLLAVKALVQDPVAYGIALWPVADEPYVTVVDIDAQIDVALAAELADMEIGPFQLLNPGFSHWATDPDGPHRLLLPIDRVERFKLRLAELPADQRVTWLRHQIKSGETLSDIAARYGTTVATLQHANGLRSSRIQAGSHLLVPQAMSTSGASAFAGARTTMLREPALEPDKPHTHIVRRGETLWSISHSYDVSIFELVSWNNKESSSVIRPGERLIVWGEQINAHPTIRAIRYSVQRGDSLYAIARRFKVTIAELRRWNNMHDETLLQPGQAMTLYVNTAQRGDKS